MLRHFPTEDVAEKLDIHAEKMDRVIEDLCTTQFAFDEIGFITDPDRKDGYYTDNVREFGEYFLSLYAEGRLQAEVKGEDPDEDLFYAGACLIEEANAADEEAEALDEEIFDMDHPDRDFAELMELIREFQEKETAVKKKQPDGKVVPLFGEKKGKKK